MAVKGVIVNPVLGAVVLSKGVVGLAGINLLGMFCVCVAYRQRLPILAAFYLVSLLSVIGGWGGALPPHFGQKKAGDLFQISCSVCRCVGGGYLIVKVRGKLTRCEADSRVD